MIKTAIVFALTVAAVAFSAEKAPPAKEFDGLPLVFSEDFEKGGDRWSPTDAKAWKIMEENGNHVYGLFQSSNYEPPVRSPKSISWIKDLKVSDFVLEAKVKQTSREYGHRDFCVFFGCADPSHFYYVHLATKSDAHANSIFLVNGAPRVSIAKERTDGTSWDNEYHTVRVIRNAQSGLIQVFRDDMKKPIMTAEDKTFTVGRIGFGSFDDVGNVDDVCIWGTRP
jgi:hypothetical protein